MTRRLRGLGIAALLAALAGCSAGTHRQLPAVSAAADTGFVLAGNPEAPGGATWSYRGRLEGVRYDLSGVLLKPPGPGPFPAVLLSHGYAGNAAFYAAAVGRAMVRWGLVVIAVNYTHASGVPTGAPGDASEPGASRANLLRAQRTVELLRGLGYVDMARLAAHGHSMGAYLTSALLSAHPGEFRVASHTGGGVRPAGRLSLPAPSPAAVAHITTPYQLHHGEDDETVPLAYEQRLESILTAHHVQHQLYVYPGMGHLESRGSPLVLQHVHDWYARHGMF